MVERSAAAICAAKRIESVDARHQLGCVQDAGRGSGAPRRKVSTLPANFSGAALTRLGEQASQRAEQVNSGRGERAAGAVGVQYWVAAGGRLSGAIRRAALSPVRGDVGGDRASSVSHVSGGECAGGKRGRGRFGLFCRVRGESAGGFRRDADSAAGPAVV
eukprot:ctg_795.g315